MRGQVEGWLYIACGIGLAGSGRTRHGQGAQDGWGWTARERGWTWGERGWTGWGTGSN